MTPSSQQVLDLADGPFLTPMEDGLVTIVEVFIWTHHGADRHAHPTACLFSQRLVSPCTPILPLMEEIKKQIRKGGGVNEYMPFLSTSGQPLYPSHPPDGTSEQAG